MTEVLDSLRELTTWMMEIRDQMNLPSRPESQPPVPTPAVSASVPVKEPWVPPPDRYEGDFGLCRSFLLQCDLVFSQQPLSYSTEQSRIAYLMGLLRGNALAWAAFLWEKRSPVTTTYAAFSAEMRRVFGHPVRGQDASERLLSFRQAMHSVAEFSVEFRTLSLESGWNNESLQAVFSQGLNDAIEDELGSYPEPPDLEGLVSLAIHIDNRLRERRREKQRRPLTAAPGHSPSASKSRGHQSEGGTVPGLLRRDPSPEPMQLGRFHLEPEERQRRIRSNSCLYCGKPGHFLASCPNQ